MSRDDSAGQYPPFIILLERCGANNDKAQAFEIQYIQCSVIHCFNLMDKDEWAF